MQYTDCALWEGVPADLVPLRRRLVDVDQLRRPFALEVAPVRDKKHPCYGARALVAGEYIPAGERLIDYAGQVCVELAHAAGGARGVAADGAVGARGDGGGLGAAGFNRSSYLLNIYSNKEEGVYIDIDAERCGNESRFANDYRGTGARAAAPAAAAGGWAARGRGVEAQGGRGAVSRSRGGEALRGPSRVRSAGAPAQP